MTSRLTNFYILYFIISSSHVSDTFALPLSFSLISQKQIIHEHVIGFHKIPFHIDVLLGLVILLFASLNLFILRIFYIISRQPWKAKISRSEILHESLHWTWFNRTIVKSILGTFPNYSNKGICYLLHGPRRSSSPYVMTDQEQRLVKKLWRRFDISQSESRHKQDAPLLYMPFGLPTTNAVASINSNATSHSPVLSLSPTSGFYSLIESTDIAPSTGSVLQSFLEMQNSPLNSGDETAPLESKYSPGGPLETISEEYEDHQEDTRGRETSSSLFTPLFDIYNTQDLRFIFFQPKAERKSKVPQTSISGTCVNSGTQPILREDSSKLTLDDNPALLEKISLGRENKAFKLANVLPYDPDTSIGDESIAINFISDEVHQTAPMESLSVSSTSTNTTFHSTMTSLPPITINSELPH